MSPSSNQSEFLHVANIVVPTTLPQTSVYDLPKSFVASYLNLLLSGQFAIDAGGADGVLTPEGILSLISEIRLRGTSKTGRSIGTFKKADFAALYYMRSFLAHAFGYRVNPTPITKGSTPVFAADVQLDFQMDHSDEERKTLLNADELSELSLEIDWRPYADVFSAGTITTGAAGIALKVAVRQFTADAFKKVPYGLHICEYKEAPVVAAQSDFQFKLQRKNLLRGVMIKTFTRNAVIYHTPVDTVINSVKILGNKKEIKNFSSQTMLKAENQSLYGITPATGYTFIDFMSNKRWEQILDEREYGDVDIVMDVNGIANSVVRVYPIEVQLN